MLIIGKRVAGIIIAILLILPIMLIPVKASMFVDNTDIISDDIICDDQVEKKVICNATIDDEFEEDSIIVVLEKDANPNLQTLTKSDFPEIQAKNVDSLH